MHWREDLRLHQAKPDDPSRPLGDDAWGEAEVDVDVGGSLTPEERAEQDSARAEVRSELHGRWRGPPNSASSRTPQHTSSVLKPSSPPCPQCEQSQWAR